MQFLAAYTWSKTLSDAGDLLNGGSISGYRAPDVPGFGPSFDRGLADFDIRNVFHVSGDYELPFGKDKKFLGNSSKIENAVVGGWALTRSLPFRAVSRLTSQLPHSPPREQTARS